MASQQLVSGGVVMATTCTASTRRPAAAFKPFMPAKQIKATRWIGGRSNVAASDRSATAIKSSRTLAVAVKAEISYVMIKPDGG